MKRCVGSESFPTLSRNSRARAGYSFLMKLAIAVLIALGGTRLAHADDKKYTMADLKALVTQQSYREAVQHLDDVAPSERNADWQEVAGTAAAGFVASLDEADE